MTRVGGRVKVGSELITSGVYLHTSCRRNKKTFSDPGDRIPPCDHPSCTNKGADWELIEDTGTT